MGLRSRLREDPALKRVAVPNFPVILSTEPTRKKRLANHQANWLWRVQQNGTSGPAGQRPVTLVKACESPWGMRCFFQGLVAKHGVQMHSSSPWSAAGRVAYVARRARTYHVQGRLQRSIVQGQIALKTFGIDTPKQLVDPTVRTGHASWSSQLVRKTSIWTYRCVKGFLCLLCFSVVTKRVNFVVLAWQRKPSAANLKNVQNPSKRLTQNHKD